MSLHPLPLDERRILKLTELCDALEAENPSASRNERLAEAYRNLARACDAAADNARAALQGHAS